MLRGAILGFGQVAAGGHLPGWLRRTDVEIVAVTDACPARRSEAARRLPGARWHDSAAALLAAERLDFVDICTPPSSHASLILAALERGLHVLCEKPLVSSPAELAQVRGQAAARGRVLFTVHNWHAAPVVRRVTELIEAGAIGEVTAVSWETLRTRPAAVAGDADNWRVDPAIAGGGVLADHGWHTCYILQRWVGAVPVAVSATLETRRHHGLAVEDTATVQLVFPSAKADVFLTWAAEARGNRAEVVGTAGVLQALDDTVVWQPRAGSERRWEGLPALSSGSAHPEWFDEVAAGFVAAVAGAAPAAGNLDEAGWCAAITWAARASSRQGGRPIALEAGP